MDNKSLAHARWKCKYHIAKLLNGDMAEVV